MRGQRHAPAALYPRERPGIHCTEGWVGPRAGLDRCGKSRPYRDSIPGPSSPYPVAILTKLPGPQHDRGRFFCRLPMDGLFTIQKACIREEKRAKRQINNVVSLRSFNNLPWLCWYLTAGCSFVCSQFLRTFRSYSYYLLRQQSF